MWFVYRSFFVVLMDPGLFFGSRPVGGLFFDFVSCPVSRVGLVPVFLCVYMLLFIVSWVFKVLVCSLFLGGCSATKPVLGVPLLFFGGLGSWEVKVSGCRGFSEAMVMFGFKSS